MFKPNLEKQGDKTMAIKNGIFGDGVNLQDRYVPDYKQLKRLVDAWRTLRMKIVLTQGTFDLIHVGHSRYLEAAKTHGDILIVGVDSDEKVRSRKGPTRPVVGEDERIEMLCHQRHVDVVTIKPLSPKKWELIKLVRPEVLIATQETYSEQELIDLKEFCGSVIVLPPQATTSTSAKIRLLHVGHLTRFKEKLALRLPALIDELISMETGQAKSKEEKGQSKPCEKAPRKVPTKKKL